MTTSLPVTVRRRLLAMLGAALLLPALGCTTATPTATPSPPPVTTPVSPTPPRRVPPTSEQRTAIDAAYRAYWHAIETAWQHEDWEQRLAEFATGDQLDTMTDRLRTTRDAGRSLRGTVTLHPTVEWVLDTGVAAHLRDCQDGSRFLVYDDRTGRPIGRGVPRNDLVEADLELVDGRWKVGHANSTPSAC